MTSHDWLDEQMDQADLNENECAGCHRTTFLGPTFPLCADCEDYFAKTATSQEWLDKQYPRCTMLVYGGEYPVRCDRAPVRDGMCGRHADAVDARDRKGAHTNWKREEPA